jgi:predicted enzyme related to lactoylglutathione lyase
MEHTHHVIDYFEISVGDVARAKRFYGEAFGWSFNDYGEEYAGITSPGGDGEVGGLAAGRDAGPGGTLLLVYSQDLDASVAAVRAAGGTVVEEPYDYPGGRRFFFADPSGNKLGVYQPSDA